METRKALGAAVAFFMGCLATFPAAARTLAKELGRLSLALEQAGAYIAQRSLGFAHYVKDTNRLPEAKPLMRRALFHVMVCLWLLWLAANFVFMFFFGGRAEEERDAMRWRLLAEQHERYARLTAKEAKEEEERART